MLSNYHIDLWEHASKLYRLSRWQQAADIFEFLGKDITGIRERTLCLLNKTLIEARLGDLQKAALTIADVAELGEDLSITAYIAGLVNCEMSQLILGEAWFEACLNGMNLRDVDYSDDRMGFILEYAAVQHNYESGGQARMAQEVGYEDAASDDLCYLPAELIFEAPSRSNEPAPVADTLPSQAEATTGEERGSRSGSSYTSKKRPRIPSAAPSSPYSPVSLSKDSLAPLIHDEWPGSPGTLSFERDSPSPGPLPQPKPAYMPILVDPEVSLKSPTLPSTYLAEAKELRALERIRLRDAAVHTGGESPSYPRTKVPYTWHGCQKPNFEPRDARGVSDSTRELARFVHDYAPEGSYPVRKLATKNALQQERDEEVALSPRDAVEGHEKLSKRFGATPVHHEEQEKARTATPRSSVEDADSVLHPSIKEATPSLQRSATMRAVKTPIKNGSLLRTMTSPIGGVAARRNRQQASKMRWPFEDDNEHDDEIVQQAQALARAQTFAQEQVEKKRNAQARSATGSALKPTPLDFIMGPDGKTVVIERPPKPAIPQSRTLPTVAEDCVASTVSLSPKSVTFTPDLPSIAQTLTSSMEAELPILQPTVYQPPTWRQIKDTLLSPGKPQISSPLRDLSFTQQTSPSLSLFPRHQVDSKSRVMPPPSPLVTPGGRGASRVFPSSAVSSVNMFDYILDKIKSDDSKGKAGR